VSTSFNFTSGVFQGIVPPSFRSQFGASVQQTQAAVANSAVIYNGDIVAISSGVISQAISLPSTNNTGSLSGGSTSIYGIALQNFTANASGVDTTTQPGVTVTTCAVALFDANMLLLLPGYNATSSSATLAAWTVGTSYQFGRYRGASSTSWWYYIGTTTTNGEMEYEEQYGLSNTQFTSTWIYPPIWLRVNGAYRQGGY
jgi:hypothetical protein